MRGDATGGGEAPEGVAEFASILFMFATSALIHLGESPDPVSGEKKQDLRQAQHAIDLLDILRAKTKGNLTPEEEQLFEGLLYDLRVRYLKAAKGTPIAS